MQKKNKIRVMGVGLGGVWVDVNKEVKFLCNLKKKCVCYFSMRNPYVKFQDDISFQNIIVAKFQGAKFQGPKF